MKPVARWTIGPSTLSGYECLNLSIESFTRFYDVDVVICHNCSIEKIKNICFRDIEFINQKETDNLIKIPPIGVAWKLYPPRINKDRHEIIIDNDIVFEDRIPEIDKFLEGDCTLLLEGDSRTYGRFEDYVPVGYEINSGIFGMPPQFDFYKYFDFYCNTEWQINAKGQHASSKTFDEQGLVSLSLLDYKDHIIIPNTSVTNCEHKLTISKGMHFIGLNRSRFHRPYAEYRASKKRLYL